MRRMYQISDKHYTYSAELYIKSMLIEHLTQVMLDSYLLFLTFFKSSFFDFEDINCNSFID